MATGSSETDRNLPLSYASLDHSEELKWPALFINDHENTLFFKKKSFFYFRLFYTHRRAPGCAESFCAHTLVSALGTSVLTWRSAFVDKNPA